MQQNIAFIGAGNMTSAIVKGLLSQGMDGKQVMVTNRSLPKLNALREQFGVNISTDNHSAFDFAETLILAVKPFQLAEMVNDLDARKEKKQYISLAAGKTIAQLQAMLGAVPLIRAMPNTPAAMQLGVTGLYANELVSEQLRAQANYLFAAVGQVVWCQRETQINDIIACAGSAPAYLFRFAEAMQNKAEQLGFSAEEAANIVRQVFIGSASMMQDQSVDFTTLRENVTSKGGTTFAALQYFEQAELTTIVDGAMQAAIDRAIEIEEGN